jgi:hypothetical protein
MQSTHTHTAMLLGNRLDVPQHIFDALSVLSTDGTVRITLDTDHLTIHSHNDDERLTGTLAGTLSRHESDGEVPPRKIGSNKPARKRAHPTVGRIVFPPEALIVLGPQMGTVAIHINTDNTLSLRSLTND